MNRGASVMRLSGCWDTVGDRKGKCTEVQARFKGSSTSKEKPGHAMQLADKYSAHAKYVKTGEHYVSVPQKQLEARKGELTKLMKESKHATKHFVSSIQGMEAILQQSHERADRRLLPGDGVLVPHLLHGDVYHQWVQLQNAASLAQALNRSLCLVRSTPSLASVLLRSYIYASAAYMDLGPGHAEPALHVCPQPPLSIGDPMHPHLVPFGDLFDQAALSDSVRTTSMRYGTHGLPASTLCTALRTPGGSRCLKFGCAWAPHRQCRRCREHCVTLDGVWNFDPAKHVITKAAFDAAGFTKHTGIFITADRLEYLLHAGQSRVQVGPDATSLPPCCL